MTLKQKTTSLNEGSVAWDIDLAKNAIIRDKRMASEKDNRQYTAD